MIYRTVSSAQIIAKIYRDLKITRGDWEMDAFEWIGEALEHIGAGVQLEKKEALLTLVSFKSILPSDLMSLQDVFYSSGLEQTHQSYAITVAGGAGILSLTINGVAYAETFDSDAETTADNWITTHAATLAALTTPVNGIIATASSAVITLSIVDWASSFTSVDSSTTLTATHVATAAVNFMDDAIKFPLRPSGATIHEGVHTTLRGDTPDFVGESFILNPDYIHASVETGYLGISYRGLPLDDNGFPNVPDNQSYRDAFKWYIVRQLLEGGWKHPSPEIGYMVADAKWQLYCTQARNAATFPDIDGYERFQKIWVRMAPGENLRDNFFDDHDPRNPSWLYGNENVIED